MGSALSKAAHWTPGDSGNRTLALTPLNDTLLSEILQFVENLRSVHRRAADSVFQEPLQWTTALQKSDLQTGYRVSKSGAGSEKQDWDGRPLLKFSPPRVSVRNFSLLSELLYLSKDKLSELRAALQENTNAVEKIVGSKFAALLESDNNKEIEKLKATNQGANVRLLLLLQTLNKQVLDKVVQQISEQIHLYVNAFKHEVETLQMFCGNRKRDCLTSLRYTSDFVFANGCRAPPHRQLLGEMAYVVVETYDTEPLYATCCKQGVFLNQGVKEYEAEESQYERISGMFEDLTPLLKKQSSYFAENIHKEDKTRRLYRPVVLPKRTPPSILDVLTIGRKTEGHCFSSADKQDSTKPKTKSKADFSLTSSPGRSSPLKSRGPGRSRLKKALSESSPESEEEEELERTPDTNTDLPLELLTLQKLIKYLREGDQAVTVLTMCSLMEFDLTQETYQLALRDLGGLNVLLNILDTKEIRCIIGSLKILRLVSLNAQIQRSMAKMRAVQSLVPLLDINLPELQALAAETLANVAKFRKARRTVRHCEGIDKLVRLLDCAPDAVSLSPKKELDMETARCAALALWSCSRSTRNKEAIRKAEGIPVLGRLLHSSHININMLIPVTGILQECASEESYRQAIRSEEMIKGPVSYRQPSRSEGMLKALVKNLGRDNEELQMHSASVIFKCAEDEKTRELIFQYKGLQHLAKLLSKTDNKPLLAAVTGAIWKCSLSQKNVTKFQEFRVVESLVSLMSEQPEEVLVNAVGALGEFALIPANRDVIRQNGGIERLAHLLTNPNQPLLVNVTRALGTCATDMENMAIIDQLDGLRLVWSLLKNPSPEVQASAAWALCPIIENGKDVAESMRRLIGGFQLLIKLLKSTDNEVLASICAVIAKITEDKEENVALLTDYGVVPLLANLTSTTDDRLRRHLAEAIAYCCMWGQNRAAFGKAGAVAPLVRYVKSKNDAVHETTVVALYQLSKDVDNCITLHSNGVVKPLLELMGHDKEDVAYMAAGCCRNIRMLANANKFANDV